MPPIAALSPPPPSPSSPPPGYLPPSPYGSPGAQLIIRGRTPLHPLLAVHDVRLAPDVLCLDEESPGGGHGQQSQAGQEEGGGEGHGDLEGNGLLAERKFSEGPGELEGSRRKAGRIFYTGAS